MHQVQHGKVHANIKGKEMYKILRMKCSWYLSINVLVNIKLREKDAVPLPYSIIPFGHVLSTESA